MLTFSLPSMSAILFDAIPFINMGLFPRRELTPPTILNPRLPEPLRGRVIVYSKGLEDKKHVTTSVQYNIYTEHS